MSLLFLVAAGPVLMTLSNARSVYSTSQQHCNLVECLSSSPSACANWTLLPTYKMASICRSIIPQNIVFTSFLFISHIQFFLSSFIHFAPRMFKLSVLTVLGLLASTATTFPVPVSSRNDLERRFSNPCTDAGPAGAIACNSFIKSKCQSFFWGINRSYYHN